MVRTRGTSTKSTTSKTGKKQPSEPMRRSARSDSARSKSKQSRTATPLAQGQTVSKRTSKSARQQQNQNRLANGHDGAALTDDEDSGSEAAEPIPKTKSLPAQADEDEPMGDHADDGEEEEDEDEDLEPDEFVVESILGHKLDLKTGELRFHVKWEGYDDPQDRTWEPEDNLAESASEILQEYYNSNGGRDAVMDQTNKAVKNKKRSRQSNGAAPVANKRSKRAESDDVPAPVGSRGFKTPAGSWEERIVTLDAAYDHESGKLAFFATWEDGTKTKHDKETIYKRCPIKAIRFFERHLKTQQIVVDAPGDET